MTELLTETNDEVLDAAIGDDGGDTTIRARVFLADGRSYDVTQRYSTATRKWENAIKGDKGDAVVHLNLAPKQRLSLHPGQIANIEELRG